MVELSTSAVNRAARLAWNSGESRVAIGKFASLALQQQKFLNKVGQILRFLVYYFWLG